MLSGYNVRDLDHNYGYRCNSGNTCSRLPFLAVDLGSPTGVSYPSGFWAFPAKNDYTLRIKINVLQGELVRIDNDISDLGNSPF